MIDLLIAKTQRNISYLYWLLFAGALIALMFLPKPLEDSTKTLLITLLSVLGTLITQQNSFWYARSRAGGIPDPNTTTTVQSTQITTTPTENPNAIQNPVIPASTT